MNSNLFDYTKWTATDWITVPGLLLLVFPTMLVIVVLALIWVWNVSLVSKVPSPRTYAFFHPYCSGGGGGERVLWKIVQHLQRRHGATQQKLKIVIFTIDAPETDEKLVREEAQRRFDVQIPDPIYLVSLEDCRSFLKPQPFLSLVMESLGTMKLAYAALRRASKQGHEVDVFCDTTGCAFTFLVARWMRPSAWILAYVHYPTISVDMMKYEWQLEGKSFWKKTIKLVYYWLFSVMYGLVGSLADLVMVNSTWTYRHIRSLWKFSKSIDIVYPPCKVSSPSELDNSLSSLRQPYIASIGQFRPEKNHKLQIEAFARLLALHPQHRKDGAKLVLIGSCRNDDDRQRLTDLKQLVQQLGVEDSVVFSINPPYEDLQEQISNSSIGIHTMRQEHFGIGIVEMMAAGLLVVAHNSGGPLTDIVAPGRTGYLATSAEEYAEAMHQAMNLSETESDEMRQKARISAARFSDQVFDDSLTSILPKLIER